MRNLLYALSTILFIGCNNKVPDNKTYEVSNGVFVVCEGNFRWGNGTLSFYNSMSKTVENDVFSSANGFTLGDVPVSMQVIGNKAYMVVNNSSKIVVFDPHSFVLLKNIRGLKSPRNIVQVSSQKAYVSDLYETSIAVLDLTKDSIISRIDVGKTTESFVVYQQYVFVTNWSKLAHLTVENNTVMVIDTNNDKLIASIPVGIEPNSIVLDKNNKIWVLCGGGYLKEENPSLVKIDAKTLSKEATIVFPNKNSTPTNLKINRNADSLFYLNTDVFVMSVTSTTVPDKSLITGQGRLIYGLGIDEQKSEIYVSDAKDYTQPGFVYRYSFGGIALDTFRVGINPSYFYFVY